MVRFSAQYVGYIAGAYDAFYTTNVLQKTVLYKKNVYTVYPHYIQSILFIILNLTRVPIRIQL